MQKYKLIKTYPGSPRLDTTIFKNGPYWSNVIFHEHFWKHEDVFNPALYSEYWKKVNEWNVLRLPEWERARKIQKQFTEIILYNGFAKEGDTVYGVSLTCPECYVRKIILQKIHIKAGLCKSRLWFKDQDSAYEYLYRNIKILSYKDIRETKQDGEFLFKLVELIKKRIQRCQY